MLIKQASKQGMTHNPREDYVFRKEAYISQAPARYFLEVSYEVQERKIRIARASTKTRRLSMWTTLYSESFQICPDLWIDHIISTSRQSILRREGESVFKHIFMKTINIFRLPQFVCICYKNNIKQ